MDDTFGALEWVVQLPGLRIAKMFSSSNGSKKPVQQVRPQSLKLSKEAQADLWPLKEMVQVGQFSPLPPVTERKK